MITSQDILKHINSPSISFNLVLEVEIRETLKNLQPTNSFKYLDLDVLVIKAIGDYLAESLIELLNESFLLASFSDCFTVLTSL